MEDKMLSNQTSTLDTKVIFRPNGWRIYCCAFSWFSVSHGTLSKETHLLRHITSPGPVRENVEWKLFSCRWQRRRGRFCFTSFYPWCTVLCLICLPLVYNSVHFHYANEPPSVHVETNWDHQFRVRLICPKKSLNGLLQNDLPAERHQSLLKA